MIGRSGTQVVFCLGFSRCYGIHRPRPHGLRPCRTPVLEAVEILYLAWGGSGIAETNPVQRAWRDLHAIAMHGALAYEVNQEMFGRMLLGLTPNTTLI